MRLMLTCVAAALLAGPAAAGPIEWSFKTEVVYTSDYGDRFVVHPFAGGPAVTQDGIWNGTGYDLFYSTVNPRPLPGSYETRYSFRVDVTITDAASGESATRPFGGWYSAVWSYPPAERDNPDAWRRDWEASGFGNPWEWDPVRLGDVAYSVRAYGGGQGQAPNGVLVVGTDFVGTPEPGTLALAALGLGVVGVARRRR